MTRLVHLVRHGRSLPAAERPPHEWPLHPMAARGLAALSAAAVLPGTLTRHQEGVAVPDDALWFSSPEPKALQTARVLTDGAISVHDDLREAVRSAHWFDDPVEFHHVVRRCFADPGHSAHPGWEPLRHTRTRVVGAVRALLHAGTERDLVLVGHGTAWTLVVAALTGAEPDLDAWAAMRMPDHCAVHTDTGTVRSSWGSWTSGTLERP
ncbi:MAG TPA: histidine phosphatase family protein [Nocardioidaceae bacterium]|nr:phosphoglycerate mutase family protein [Actinomycetota bacterium]HEV8056013.1 histidine phosphatase family protein [Nocardioidaceae bacterium]